MSGRRKAIAAILIILALTMSCQAADIHDAVAKRDLAALDKALLKKPDQINARNYPDFLTPLYMAVSAGDPDIVKRLLDAGADPLVHAVPGVRMTPAERCLLLFREEYFVIHCEQLNAMNSTIRFGGQDFMGRVRKALASMPPPLSAEETENRIRVAKMIFSKVPDHALRKTADIGITAATGSVALLQHVLSFGGNPDARDALGLKPLHYAVMGNAGRDVIQLLVSKGADVDWGNMLGVTPLMYAAALNKEELVRALIAAGASPELEDIHGVSVICFAAESGNDALVRVIHDKGGPGLIRYGNHRALFHSAAKSGSMALVDLLLAERLDVNIKDENGYTPLLHAVENGRSQVARVLLKNGADRSAKLKDGRGVFQLACVGGDVDLLNECMTVERPGKELLNHMLMEACQSGHMRVIMSLMENGADANAPVGMSGMPMPALAWTVCGRSRSINKSNPSDDDVCAIIKYLIGRGARADWQQANGVNLLHLATTVNRGENTIRELVKAGVPADVQLLDKTASYTPMLWAAQRGNVQAMRILKGAGADLGKRSSGDHGVLHMAAVGARVEALAYLIEKGVDLNDRSKIDGRTPLHHAVFANSSECVSFLLKNGADVNALDKGNFRPLMYAANRKDGMQWLRGEVYPEIHKTRHALISNERERLRIVYLLLEAGSKMDGGNMVKDGITYPTLVDFAKVYGSQEIVDLLQNPPKVRRRSDK